MSDNTYAVTDQDFTDKVLNSDKPVLVDFWAEWCAPCKMMGQVINELAGEVDDQITICKLDVDDNSQTAMKYGIRNIPALMIFKDGEVQAQTAGAMNKRQLQSFINENL